MTPELMSHPDQAGLPMHFLLSRLWAMEDSCPYLQTYLAS
jgi:hypothetical protein